MAAMSNMKWATIDRMDDVCEMGGYDDDYSMIRFEMAADKDWLKQRKLRFAHRGMRQFLTYR